MYHLLFPFIKPDIIQETNIPVPLHLTLISVMGILTIINIFKPFRFLTIVLVFLYTGSALAETLNTVKWAIPESSFSLNLYLATIDFIVATLILYHSES